MDYINRVELAGTIGAVRLTQFGEHTIARMSLATENVYGDNAGKSVKERAWHNVVVWQKPGMADLAKLSKGSGLYITGRLCYSRYTGADGKEMLVCEILADTLKETEVRGDKDDRRS